MGVQMMGVPIMGVPLMGVPLIRSMYRVEPQHSTYILRSLRSSPTPSQQVLIGFNRVLGFVSAKDFIERKKIAQLHLSLLSMLLINSFLP